MDLVVKRLLCGLHIIKNTTSMKLDFLKSTLSQKNLVMTWSYMLCCISISFTNRQNLSLSQNCFVYSTWPILMFAEIPALVGVYFIQCSVHTVRVRKGLMKTALQAKLFEYTLGSVHRFGFPQSDLWQIVMLLAVDHCLPLHATSSSTDDPVFPLTGFGIAFVP